MPRPAAPPAPPLLTHPDRLLWPEEGISKRMLADYFAAVAPRLLRHVAGRPLSLLRAPRGIGGARFFQRHPGPGLPPALRRVALPGAERPFLAVEDAGGLAALAQIAAIELHPWGARAEDPERPDRLVLDLDPAEDLPFARVVEAALALRERLRRHGLAPFCKSTGGKGLHLVVPLLPRAFWPEVAAFARAVCEAMAAEAPERFTTSPRRRDRAGRILLDHLRNERGASAIAPWSPRARAGAPVAMPLAWEEVGPDLDPRGVTLATAPARRDPWDGFEAAARPLPG
ncbi:non-homologous end-joining DNA ligase [Crenalkalicoccus roseus]|uniref:non-homologous end-joining DNA ligase n=1 Tax=Crenalkalicoccus roseus TaxID=1485588 RepID=UPI0010803628|nr:non-homologous end-joining DNA ligase [Crenalkalicoccus roseus]